MRWILFGGGLIGVILAMSFAKSKQLKDFIARWEGEKLQPYKDVAGHWTIGIGHLIKPDEDYLMRGITAQKSQELFVQDIGRFIDVVNSLVKVPLSKKQRIAIVSLAYNIGPNNFASSTLLKKLNSGDYVGAADEFWKWRKAGGEIVQGLVNRRASEEALFREGTKNA